MWLACITANVDNPEKAEIWRTHEVMTLPAGTSDQYKPHKTKGSASFWFLRQACFCLRQGIVSVGSNLNMMIVHSENYAPFSLSIMANFTCRAMEWVTEWPSGLSAGIGIMKYNASL